MRQKNFVGLVLVMVLSISLTLVGCGTSKPTQTNTQNASAGGKVVNIGWSGPLSGGSALYGQNNVEGVSMAVDEINANGGITVNGQKYSIKLVTLDDQYQPNLTATNARRLRDEYKCSVIFTPHSGGVFALQDFNQEQKFLIAAYTSEPKILERGNKLTYRITFGYDGYAEPFSKAVMEKYGKRVALVPGTHQYAKDWTALFVPVWQKLGGEVTGNFAVDYNKETDFYTYVSKALATKPDVIFIGGASKPTAMIVKQARQLGFKGGFILMDQAKLEEMAETVSMQDLTGAVGVMPLSQFPSAGAPKFVAAFKAKYNGKVPTHEMGLNYMAMKEIAKGMEKAGSVNDAEQIFAGIKAIMPMEDQNFPFKVTGISDKGAMQSDALGVMVIDGKYGPPIPIPSVK